MLYKRTRITPRNNRFLLSLHSDIKTSETRSKTPIRPSSQGEIPDELLRDAKGGEVNLNMEDHRDEAYTPPPKPKVVAFSGTGYVLGSPAPNIVDQAEAQPTPSQDVPAAVTVDASQPTASIHVRLDDGSRYVCHRTMCSFSLEPRAPLFFV